MIGDREIRIVSADEKRFSILLYRSTGGQQEHFLRELEHFVGALERFVKEWKRKNGKQETQMPWISSGKKTRERERENLLVPPNLCRHGSHCLLWRDVEAFSSRPLPSPLPLPRPLPLFSVFSVLACVVALLGSLFSVLF